MVHLILTSIPLNSSSNVRQDIGTYEIQPMTFPLILSNYKYSTTPKGGLSCNKDQEHLYEIHSSDFLFRVPPQHKLNCVTQVYIDPKPCKLWNIAGYLNKPTFGNELKGISALTKPHCPKIVPETHWDPVFDHKISRNTDRDFLLNTVAAVKSNWILIHVIHESPNLLSSIKVGSNWQDIFFVFDYQLLDQFGSVNTATLSTKLVLAINLSKPKNQFEVKTGFKIFLSSPKSIQPFFQKVNEECLRDKVTTQKAQNFKTGIVNRHTGISRTYIATPRNKMKCINRLTEKNLRLYWRACDIKNGYTNLHDCSTHEERYDQMVVLLDSGFSSLDVYPILSEKAEDLLLIKHLLPNSTVLDRTEITKWLRHFPVIKITTITSWTQNTFWETEDGVYFLSCAKQQKNEWLSLAGYTSAFHWHVWIGILISGFICGLIVHRILLSKNMWNNCTFVYSILVCQSTNIIHKSRCICGAWILAGVVLSYAYQGDNITKLTKPLGSKPFETFVELYEENFALYSPMKNSYGQKPKSYNIKGFTDNYIQELKQKKIDRLKKLDFSQDIDIDALLSGSTEIEQYWFRNFIALGRDTTHAINYLKRALKFSKILHSPDTESEYIEIAINFPAHFANLTKTKCTNIAYIDTREKILKTYRDLRQEKGAYSEYLHVGHSRYEKLYKVWFPKNFPMSPDRFTKRLEAFYYSGLLEYWKKWRYRKLLWRENVEQEKQSLEALKPKKLSTRGNIVVVFYLLVVLLIGTVVLFIIEASKLIIQSLNSIYHVVQTKLFLLIQTIFLKLNR